MGQIRRFLIIEIKLLLHGWSFPFRRTGLPKPQVESHELQNSYGGMIVGIVGQFIANCEAKIVDQNTGPGCLL
ncbi:hypothetical protein Hanom_Chr17g01534891 [Helianthus anomalus]